MTPTPSTERELLARELAMADYGLFGSIQAFVEKEWPSRLPWADHLIASGWVQKAEVVEECAKIADTYTDWTYWGQHDNDIAATGASREIAAAIRIGRALTPDEIKQVDRALAPPKGTKR